MKQRIITGATLVAILVLVLLARQLSTYIFDAFMVIIAMYACYETSHLFAKMGVYNNKYFAIAYPLFAYGLFVLCLNLGMRWYMLILMELALIIVFVMAQWFLSLIMYKSTKNEIATRNLKLRVESFSIYKAIQTMYIYLYPAILMLFFVFINDIAVMSDYFTTYTSNALFLISTFGLILTFIIPIFTDTFAYLTGSLFKGRKLCPKISPNKTISGAVGGVFWGTISAVLLYLIFNAFDMYAEVFTQVGFAFWHFIIIGFIASVVCELGDLLESYIKRKANVKDSGDILPGHGGILDRMDSHIVCAPLIFIFLVILL